MATRWFIALFLVLLLVPLASIALILRSESTVLAALEWAIDNLTDYDLELVDPYIDIYAGTAGARQVHLHQDTAYGPAIVSVLNLSGERIRWRDLLLATLREANLSADAVVIYVSESDEVSDPQPMTWLSYLSWLPRKATINTVHLITRGENVWIFPLKDISGYRGDYDNFIASANADDEGEPLSLVVELHALREEDRFVGIEMAGELDALRSGGSGTFSGEIRGTNSDYEYDLDISANYPSVEDFFESYQGVGRRLRGSLVIEGRLRGNSEALELKADTMVLDNMPTYGIEASGTLSREMSSEDVLVNVISAGEIASLRILSELFDVDLEGFGRAQASARISGTLTRPQIDEFILSTRSPGGLAVNAAGRLSAQELVDLGAAEDNQITVDISGPDLARLEPWLGPLAFDPGPWFASAVVTGTRDVLSLDQLVLEAGTPATVEFRLEGSVDAIDIASTPFQLEHITGIEAVARATTDDSAALGELLDITLPPYHALDFYLEARGNGANLVGDNGRLTANASDLELNLTDMSMRAERTDAFRLSDFRATVSGELSDTSALSQYTDRPAMSAGPVTIAGELAQVEDRFEGRNLEISVTGEGLQIRSSGHIANLLTLEGIDLEQRFNGLQTENVLATLVEDFHYPHDLGDLVGSFTLRGSADDLKIQGITLTNMGSDRLSVGLKGDINDVEELDADLTFQANVTDPDLLMALTGLALAPTSAMGTLRNKGNQALLNGDMQVGRTQILSKVLVDTADSRLTNLDIEISSPHLFMEDLGLQADENDGGRYRPAEQLEGAAERSTDRVLSRAPRYPARLRIDVNEVTGENTAIDSLKFELTGKDGAYTIRQLDLTYATGLAQMRGIVDLNQQPVALSFAGQGLSIPMNRLSADLGLDTDIEGVLSFRGGITGYGSENAQFLSTLDGAMAFAIEDATIEGAAYDVLATGILEWMYSGAALETSTRLDCTMARFDFNNGVARTDNIFIETRKMIATGEATLDLVKNEIDLSLTPKSKSRQIQIPSTVRVRGPIEKPRTIVSPVSAAADASAEALTLVPKLAFRLFGIKRDSKRQTRPCEAVIN